jgi:hypothetical protein
MSAQTLFFTDESIDGLAIFMEGEDGLNYEYKEMKVHSPYLIEHVVPELIQYGLWPGSYSWPIFDLAKEYLRKKGGTFIVIMICLGYPTPPHTLMPEVVVDLKEHKSGEWPKGLVDSLPEEKTMKDYELVKGAGDFRGTTPTKKNPYFEWFTKYRLIDTGVSRTASQLHKECVMQSPYT